MDQFGEDAVKLLGEEPDMIPQGLMALRECTEILFMLVKKDAMVG